MRGDGAPFLHGGACHARGQHEALMHTFPLHCVVCALTDTLPQTLNPRPPSRPPALPCSSRALVLLQCLNLVEAAVGFEVDCTKVEAGGGRGRHRRGGDFGRGRGTSGGCGAW